ncbi:hypothetical protein AB4116_01010 [Vibrio splendidus]|uniref:hypothetical protein n=1 Tax=Vibrio splendidus TaxID=29497 RepID=UPI00031F7F3A|nr:hypothetical protein [Vibrio splendidus]OEF39334.1 hypothetical protein A150_17305 [Vibrio splendidus 1S-124]PTQ21410.1 hypothetical protein CWO14_04240 [Vibrio splendidus]
MKDELGDYRIAVVTTLTADVPAAFSGGPSYKAGTPLYQSSLVRNESNELISFILPSSTAMALNTSLKSAKRANKLRDSIEFRSVLTPDGKGLAVTNESNEALFDYFEECMVAVTFAFQTLELFCNHSISRHMTEGMEIKRNKGRLYMSPSELERQLSTEEKLALVLPKVLNKSTPKGKQPWEQYKKLKVARDSTIHMKYTDQQVLSHDTLYFQFLNNTDVTIYAEAAINMLLWFTSGTVPRWLEKLAAENGI